ncbi:MAG: transglutaminase family protein [Dermatophilaceae bacterium]
MSTQLKVVHRTGYTYPGGAHASYNEARMTPQSNTDQVVLHSRIDISPKPWTYSYVDYFGTAVTAFELHERHERLQLVATSTVEVRRDQGKQATASWDLLRSPEVTGVRGEWLEVTPLTDPGAELRAETLALAAQAGTPAEFVAAAVGHLRREMSYQPGATGVHTQAADAWAGRRGVCQDHVHLALGMLRTVGIPARYVSGYVLPLRTAALGVPATGESHAWLQWWGGEWLAFDPTNGQVPDDFAVDVGYGRDYRDVTPLRGIFTGVRTSSMFVEVEMTRLA